MDIILKADTMSQSDTILKKIDKDNLTETAFEEAGKILRNGGLVAFPTETVYGLGADALNSEAAAKIYAAKGRPSDNPLIVHIAEKEDLKRLTTDISPEAEVLIETFWPGPLTLVFHKRAEVPDGTTGGLSTVALRMPAHKIARELIRSSGVLIAAPSANLSGRPSPTAAEHVWQDMQGRIDMLIDGGKVGIGIESTIVDMTVNPPMILRPGYITREMLEEKIGPVEVDKAAQAERISEIGGNYKPKAPGMKYILQCLREACQMWRMQLIKENKPKKLREKRLELYALMNQEIIILENMLFQLAQERMKKRLQQMSTKF